MRPRSGLALQHAITMPNAPGTIDPGYRGEMRVILLNLGREPYTIHAGDRIAQMIVARYEAGGVGGRRPGRFDARGAAASARRGGEARRL